MSKPDKKALEDIHKEALEQFKESKATTDSNREAAYNAIKFARLGEQWPDDIKKQREEEGRPCLTINRLPAFIRQVVNDARRNKPGIQVKPVDGGADEDTAEVIAGIIRSIENGPKKAEAAYDTAIEHAIGNGFGFFRVGIDYVHEDSFDMHAYIDRIPNALMVHWDASSTAVDGSDWNYAFVSDFIDEDVFKTRYPKAEKVSFEGSGRDNLDHWLEEGKVRVAEYWRRTEKKRTLCQLSSGQVTRKDMLPQIARAAAETMQIDVEGLSDDELVEGYLSMSQCGVGREREATYHEVKRYMISGAEVLEEDEWPGSHIPICPVWGEEVMVDGRRHFRSMVRDAKDPQAMFNFWRTATTEVTALAPRTPFIGPQGFVPEGQSGKWETANSRSHAYLEYDNDAGPAPVRQQPAQIPTGALSEASHAADDIKAITGIYDSSLGARSNEVSGKAIRARQSQGDVSNFHFTDNQKRAIEYAGRILVDIIPSVYGKRETLRILGDDSKEKIIKLASGNPGIQDGVGGQDPLYDLNVGRYDVVVESGPSTATQREEAVDLLTEFMRAMPAAAPYMADILFDNMDFKGADKLADRARAMLPPEVQAAEGGAPQQIPGQVPGQPAVPPQPGGPLPGAQ